MNNLFSVARPAYRIGLISCFMILILFSFGTFNFDFLNVKEIDASPSYTKVSSNDTTYNEYMDDKYAKWDEQAKRDLNDDCVSGGSVNCPP